MSNVISGFEFVKANGKKALAIIVDGVAMDLSSTFLDTSSVEAITKEHPAALEIVRHTTSHIMAQAITELWPTTKIAIGPTIQNGFYYDISCDHHITQDDFSNIEKKMLEIIKADYKISRDVISKDAAMKMFSEMNEPFKLELIRDLDVAEITLYRHEDKFVDLCCGPHIPKTGAASPHFKIMKIAGAYWRGDSNREMLQRIYATSWLSKEDLDTYIHNLKEAEKRDHRKIGREMDLFHMQEEAVGSVFWHPKGWTLYRTLLEFIRKSIRKDGYAEVYTPEIIDRSLWEASGHWEKFQQNMFTLLSEGKVLAIKPMNCPAHIQIFNQTTKSYRDLPFRMAEFGNCHRNEPSGSLYGTMRVRAFTQDDGHIFCTPEQISSETKKFCDLLTRVYSALGFDTFSVKFSDRPEIRVGSDEVWDLAEKLLQDATKEAGLEYTVSKGEGAFYGPKLEFTLRDKLGRDWQCGTVQVDFILPERLGAYYTGSDGAKHHPILIHRAILGSFERFIGILLENYAGKLPMWLTPTQIAVATITNEYNDYAKKFFDALVDENIRAELDIRAEKISYKIRGHSLTKIPVIAVVGSSEVNDGTITLRNMDGTQETFGFSEAIEFMKEQCKEPIA